MLKFLGYTGLVLVFLLFGGGGVTSAATLSEDDIESITKEWTQYEDTPPPSESTCTPSGQSAAGTLPAGVPEPWNGIITAAAKEFNTNSSLLAAILYWENRAFPDPKKEWAVSSAGAKGPMQFIDSTWEAYKTDGDGDGKADVLNNYDAIYGAAKLLSANEVRPTTELGSLDSPGKNGTLLRAAANYNWGGGNVNSHGGESIKLDDMPTETSDYLKAVYALISSDFTSLPQASGGSTGAGASDKDYTNVSAACESSPLGSGTGEFSDGNTTKIPGAEAAVERAKKIANGGAKAWQAACAGNDDPNCKGYCERLASVVWGRTNSGYASAMAHWQKAVATGNAHAKDRSPPVGALLYYDTGNPSGHVATYLGDNMIISNDVGDNAANIVGGVYIVPASDMESSGWHLTYLGWVNPVPWTL